MRIVHVVTLVSPSVEFGGPLRVAVGQLVELQRRGHDVLLVAAGRGYDGFPSEVEGVPVSLHRTVKVPGLGFSGLVAPGVQRAAHRELGSADVVHVHLARDLVTLPVAMQANRRGVPMVVQPHGMIVESRHPLAGTLDALATRSILRDANAILALTPDEEANINKVSDVDLQNFAIVPNGIDAIEEPHQAVERSSDLVLFLARLHERKRPEIFVEAAALVLERRPQARFLMVGPDEGSRDPLEALIARRGIADRVTIRGSASPAEVHTLMQSAAIYVLPSLMEAFGMTVLEAMRAATPVAITFSCGLADAVSEAGAGAVTDGSAEGFAEAMVKYLENSDVARAAGRAGQDLVEAQYSIGSVVDRLEAIYERAIADRS